MILYGKPVRREYLEKLKKCRSELSRPPRLMVISDGQEDSEVYRRSILKLADKLEVEIVSDLEESDGVIQLGKVSIPDLPPEKDIEGISNYHIGLLAYNDPLYLPPTPAAALLLVEYYSESLKFSFEGAKAVVIGRSVRVGKPLALMLLNKNATVTLLHSKSRDVEEYTRMADIVFLSAGVGRAFGKEFFTSKSIIVDISTVYADGKLVGDAVFDELENYVRAITPVPGGVGSLTPLILFRNLFRAAALNMNISMHL